MVAMVTACTAALAQPAQAQTAVAGGDLTFVVGAEVSHDSSVVFLSDTGFADDPDQSLALSGNARFRRGVGTNGRFSLSYGLTSNTYLEASSRDNLLIIVTASYTHRVGQATLGASYAKAWNLSGRRRLPGTAEQQRLRRCARTDGLGPGGSLYPHRKSL